MIDLEHLCKEVNSLAREVGAFIKLQKITIDDIETKSKNSLVTYVDKTAEEMIVKKLAMLIPEAGFITEEETLVKKGVVYNWIIDPLDGTTNFIHSIPCFSISIALQRNNELVLGVIYEINLDEMFYAWEGSNAYLNGAVIKVSPTALIENSLVATGFPYFNYIKQKEYMMLFQDLMKTSRGLRRLGSAAVDLAYVACGRFDAFYEYSLNSWDVAAGAVIVKQAGGVVTDFSGNNNFLFGKELIATNNLIYGDFLKKVEIYFGDKN
ncbi:MAG: inositol monophosphatase family protein [Vicingaceae bacterium]|nr:inositol monophosphatase family protein [Vicingaceae bacterium]